MSSKRFGCGFGRACAYAKQTVANAAGAMQSNEALPLVFRMLCSRSGGESAYANPSVKAYLVCHMTPAKTSIWAGAEAPAPDDKFFTFEN